MSDKTAWDKAKNFVFGGVGAVVFVAFLGFVDWRIGVKIDEAFEKNLAKAEKIINMDRSIADNTRTGEENGEDIGQLRSANELAMRRLFGLPPPDDGG